MADVISKITLPDNHLYNLKDSGAARSDHTHDISITTTAGVTTTNLSANTLYLITAGGSSLTFKTPADANNKVTLTGTTTSAAYEILFSGTATNDTKTEGANKTSTLTYNPSTKALVTGGTVNGYTLAAAAAKGVATSISAGDTAATLPTVAAVASFVETGTKGDILYWSANNTTAHLGNTSTTTKLFLSIVSQVPSWTTLSKSDVGLGNVENTALSTWTGSNKITTVGTISTGTWQGTPVAASYVDSLPGSKITSGTVAAAYLGIMTGASSSAAGASGAVPQPAAGKQTAYLRGDGTWQPAPVLSVGGLTGAITLELLGISGAMHYKGTVAAIPPTSGTYNSGDVVVLSGTVKEYVYDGTNWRELGTEGSFKTILTAVSDPTVGTSGQINFINTISQNTNGVISVTKLPVRVASTSQTGVIQITKDNANSFLNQLDTGSSTPVDNDYYISLYVSGGTTTTTYHRRPMSALWSYIKGKADAVYKPKQTAVSSATAETTTATTFVHSITLDANGVITVKTRPLPTYNNYSLPVAKYNTLGGIKPAYTSTDAVTLTTTAATNTDKPTIAAKSTTTGRYYAVEADKNGVAYVNVPWTNVNSNYLTGITSTTSSSSGNVVTSISASGNTITYTLGSMSTSGHTHTTTLASDTGTSSTTLAHGGKYKLTAGGNSVIFTMPSDNNTTYNITTGDANGLIKVTPSSGDAYNVDVAGLGTAAYTSAGTFSTAGHTHTTSLTAGGSSPTSLGASTTYTLTAGGTSIVFKTPPNTWNAMGGATSAANGTVGYINAVPPKDGYNTKYWRADGTWAVPPDNNGYHTSGSWNSFTYTATAVGGAGALAFTIPTGTSSTQVAVGNHSHGNLSNTGTITATSTIASGDRLVIVDSDTTAGSKITGSSITFGTATNTWLNNSGTWTTPPDTKVTSVGNHYAPSADNSAELTATISGTAGTYAKDTVYTVITGIKALRDAKGHVTGITYTALNIKDTNNTYTFTNKAASLSWGQTTTIATVGGTDITVGLPANPNTDIKQNITLATTSKAFITGVTTTPTSSALALTGVADTGVYLTTAAGELSTLRHSWHDSATTPAEKVYSYWNTADLSLDFVFN